MYTAAVRLIGARLRPIKFAALKSQARGSLAANLRARARARARATPRSENRKDSAIASGFLARGHSISRKLRWLSMIGDWKDRNRRSWKDCGPHEFSSVSRCYHSVIAKHSTALSQSAVKRLSPSLPRYPRRLFFSSTSAFSHGRA